MCAALQVPLDKGERDQCENSSMPPQRVFYGFVLPAKSHWQNKTTLWGCFDPAQTGPSESVRIVYKFPRPGAGALVPVQEPSSFAE